MNTVLISKLRNDAKWILEHSTSSPQFARDVAFRYETAADALQAADDRVLLAQMAATIFGGFGDKTIADRPRKAAAYARAVLAACT